MGAMHLDSIEAILLHALRAFDKSPDDLIDHVLGHRNWYRSDGHAGEIGGAPRRRAVEPAGIVPCVPELLEHLGPCGLTRSTSFRSPPSMSRSKRFIEYGVDGWTEPTSLMISPTPLRARNS